MNSSALARFCDMQKELNTMPGIACAVSSDGRQEDVFHNMVTDKELRKHTEKLFQNGHYSRAVEEGFKFLDNAVKKTARPEDKKLSGAALMNKTFSSSSPLLKLNKGRTQSEVDEQQGYMLIFAGCMTGIRNPRAHESDWEDSETRALELLVLANHLIVKVREAQKS